MAKLEGQTIAASYDQLLHVDTEGGGNTTTLVPIKDGDNDTTFCLQLATTSALIVDDAKLYFGTGSDASIEYDEDGADNLSIAGSDVSIADGIGLIVGNTAQVAMGEVTSEVQILGTSETDASLAIGLWSTTDALSPSLKFVKGAHATIGTHTTTVADNEELGKIQAYGSDTADSDTLSSEIAFNIDDDGVGAGTLGGEILLKTSGTDGTLDTAVTIDSSQKVGIGTAAPDSPLHVVAGTATAVTGGHHASTVGIFERTSIDNSGATVTILGDNGAASILNFGDQDDADIGLIRYDHSDNYMSFQTNTSERMRIDSAGDVTFTGDLIMADGKGIDFSADASPASGMTAEILDDYEEGTWSPVVTDGSNPMTMHGTYDTGYYTKVGNLVTVSGVFYTTSLGSASGNIRITGLPFTIANDYAAYSGGGAAEGAGFDLAAAGYSVSFYGVPNSTYIYLRVWDATTGVSYMQASEWTADGGIMINFSYRAA
jgi:hypothetical protein